MRMSSCRATFLRKCCWGYFDCGESGQHDFDCVLSVCSAPIQPLLWLGVCGMLWCTCSIDDLAKRGNDQTDFSSVKYHLNMCCCVEFYHPILMMRTCCSMIFCGPCGRYSLNSPGSSEALFHAAKNGYTCLVRYLLCCGADPDMAVYNQKPADVATSNGHYKLASIISPGCHGKLAIACKNNDISAFKNLFLDKKKNCEKNNMNINDEETKQVLTLAVKEGRHEILKLMLESGVDANIAHVKGNNLIVYTIQRGFDKVALCLTEHNYTLLVSNSEEDPLMLAIKRRKPAISKALVDRIDCNISGSSPLFSAIGAGDEFADVAIGLIKRQCQLTSKQKGKKGQGDTALHAIIRESGSLEVATCLLEHNCEIDSIGDDNNTALHLALSAGNVEIAKILIESGCRVDIKNGTGETAVDMLKNIDILKPLYAKDIRIPIKALKAANFEFWFYLVQIGDCAGIESMLHAYSKSYQELVRARDSQGRLAEEVATRANKEAIRKSYLWFGRYRPLDQRPEHVSSTCYVYRAVDETVLDSTTEEPLRVALKLMRVRSQWQREILSRKCNIGENDLVEILRHYPADCNSNSLPEVIDRVFVQSNSFDDVEDNSADNFMLSNEDVESLYCLVMPLADRNMFVAIKQEGWGVDKNFKDAMYTFTQVLHAVGGIHSAEYIHADIKPLNIVRRGAKWTLIDMDACCRLGKDAIGLKSSTSVMPPEAFYGNVEKGVVCVRSESEIVSHGLAEFADPLLADVSFDVWSLGCVLYHLTSENANPLMHGGQNDNLSLDPLDGDNLWQLMQWSDELKSRKLSKVSNSSARNLLSLMLHKNPMRRPSITRILSHPFLSGKHVVRLAGDAAEFDIFLSYRVNSDVNHAETLYDMLTAKGIRVWWDKKCLKPGEPWEDGFCAGLVNSRCFVCLLSKGAINSTQNERHNFTYHVESSPCDNVFLEHRMALELRDFNYIEKIMPVLIGEVDHQTTPKKFEAFDFSSCLPNAPECHVTAVEEKLKMHLDKQGLGTPLSSNRTIKSVLNDIMACQGVFAAGLVDTAFVDVSDKIESMVKEIKNHNEDIAEGEGFKDIPDSTDDELNLKSALHFAANVKVLTLEKKIMQLEKVAEEKDRIIEQIKSERDKAENENLSLKKNTEFFEGSCASNDIPANQSQKNIADRYLNGPSTRSSSTLFGSSKVAHAEIDH